MRKILQNIAADNCMRVVSKWYKQKLSGFILLLAIYLNVVACGIPETNVERGNREQILFIGNGTEPEGLDPHITTGVSEHNIISALFEGLVSEDPIDLHPVPGVAESWDIAEEGTKYIFHLRHEAVWSNGDAVTAHDFLYSYQRILSPAMAAEYAYMLYPMKNARAFNVGEITDFSLVGVKAIDDKLLEIILEAPTPYFLELQNHYSWWPVHPPTIEEFGGMTKRGTLWARPENMVCNGPFTLDSWKINQSIIVKKNPLYWDSDKVRLKGIHFMPIDSRDAEERAFRVGYIHLTHTIPLHRVDYYRTQRPDVGRFDTYLGTYYYLINVTKPPLNDKRIRKALSLALNREAISEHVSRAGEKPAYHFTPPGTGGYMAERQLEYNLEEARSMLADAGFPNGEGLPEIELLYNTSEAHRTIAEAIQQMWSDSLNIKIKLYNQEWKVYLNTRQGMNYQIARAGWIGDYNDPNTFLDMFVTGGGNNHTGWSNPEYDSLIASASRATDSSERLAFFQKAEQILLGELPIIPIYFYVRSLLIESSVRGWHPNVLDHHPYKFVYLEAK